MPFIPSFIIRGAAICLVQSESRRLCLSLVPGSFTAVPEIMFFKKREIIFLLICLLGFISSTLKQSCVHHS